jgi:hypothetical protein
MCLSGLVFRGGTVKIRIAVVLLQGVLVVWAPARSVFQVARLGLFHFERVTASRLSSRASRSHRLMIVAFPSR